VSRHLPHLGPAFAVLLSRMSAARHGVAAHRHRRVDLRTADASLASFARADPQRACCAAFVLSAVMNCSFYLALDRLPISLVAESIRRTNRRRGDRPQSPRNLVALAIAVNGTLLLIDVKWSSDPSGCSGLSQRPLFVGYIVLGHRVARSGVRRGIAGLGAAMAVAFVVVLPLASPTLSRLFSPPLLIAVSASASVLRFPYICDQLMSRLPRASFGPDAIVLPGHRDTDRRHRAAPDSSLVDCSALLVVAGVAFHKPANTD